ncbi:MAG: hypothetical protein Q8R36_01590 [bacterium]|nr:hypothetical protein [bacterium]
MEVTDLGGDHLHGFQLNVAWPSIDGLKAYRAAHPNKQIILQIGTHAFDMISHTPSILAACVEQYTKYIDYVLLDPSGGHGKALNPHIMRDYLQALSDKHLEIGHGVAGGLGSPDALETLRPLVSDFPYLSIDAESRLRDANDNLQLIPAIQYALTSLRLFMKAQISDVDLDIMSMGRLKKEILELRSVIREHRDQIGDDRCWINDLRIYKAVPDNAPIITNLPPKEIFVGHCSHFWDTRQCPENEQNLHQW